MKTIFLILHRISFVIFVISILFMISAYLLLIPVFQNQTQNKWVTIIGLTIIGENLHYNATIMYVSNLLIYF